MFCINFPGQSDISFVWFQSLVLAIQRPEMFKEERFSIEDFTYELCLKIKFDRNFTFIKSLLDFTQYSAPLFRLLSKNGMEDHLTKAADVSKYINFIYL